MPNYVHFIVVPEHEDSLNNTFNQVNARYSQYKNKKDKRQGHLWQCRYY